MLSTDVAVGLTGFEPHIAVNPTDPRNVVVAQGSQLRISTDFGATFPTTFTGVLPPGLPAGYGINGDPVVAFDSQGRLFFTYLIVRDGDGDGNVDDTGNGDDISVVVQRVNPTTGAAVGNAVDVTPGFHLDDKQWLTADTNPDSPFADNIYLHWTRFDNDPREEAFSFSNDNGVTFSAPSTIATGGGEGFRHQSNIAVAPNGYVYAAYHINTCGNDETDGDIVIMRDSNGGADLQAGGNPPAGVFKTTIFGAGGAEVTCNRQPSASTVPKARFLMQGAAAPFVFADPARAGHVYVVANDDPDNDAGTGDDGNIVFARSTDYGNSWTVSRIDHAPEGPASLQVFPTGAIDENGNIAVFWYDTRRQLNNTNGTGDPSDDYWNLDVYATVSRDGGLTFSHDFRVNDQPFDPQLGAPNFQGDSPPTFRIGEYNGIAASNGVVHVDWTGNTAAGQQTLYDKFSMLGPFLDAFEANDSRSTATILGSLPKITLQDLTIHTQTDVDFFKYTAQDTGKLLVNLFFDDGIADLMLQVQDVFGNVIANGIQSNIAPGLDVEQLAIPVVSQEEYFLRVLTNDPFANPIVYDLEIENFAAPIPDAVVLDPSDDTGMSNQDNVTSEDDARIFIEADLADFAAMGIDILSPSEVAAQEPGAAVEVFVNGVAQGFATPIAGTGSTLFQFTFAPGDLSTTFIPAGGGSGLNFVKAAVRIYDGQQDAVGAPAPATARTLLSEPLLLTLDNTAPPLILSASLPDMLASSDTGMFDDDNVTNKMSPAFDGLGEANAKVRLYANGLLVGQGVVGSDSSDGVPGDGLGHWEITVEPLDDGIYEITAEYEDAAGNVSSTTELLDAEEQPVPQLVIEVDTVAPNTPLLDLLAADDSGRSNEDDITFVQTPRLDSVVDDPNGPDVSATYPNGHLFTDIVKYRIFDRFDTMPEALIFDQPVLIANGGYQNAVALINADGAHGLKLEVEDRAGNLSHDFLLEILLDRVAPDAPSIAIDPATSDSGVEGYPFTFADRVTSDTSTGFVGTAEADSIVRMWADGAPVSSNVINASDTFQGLTVAVPLDGNQAFPDGQWNLAGKHDLNDPHFFPFDGHRQIAVTAEDVAGNQGEAGYLDIFIDTQGPQITAVEVNQQGNPYHLFDPKPSEDGPTPLVNSLVISVRDLPLRSNVDPNFLYPALLEAVAETPGHYQLVGDANGVIAIQSVDFIPDPDPAENGQPGLGTIVLTFYEPLPDDRFTLTISDALVDPVGNALDGETNAAEPQQQANVFLPSGDRRPGGAFVARFTVDSRAELGVWAAGSVYVDTNGNFYFDPENRDTTNEDITYVLGFTSDNIFAGNFVAHPEGTADGFDKLAAYGLVAGAWRWLIDTDNNGVPNLVITDPNNVNGLPVAGNFDGNPANGDEVGLFTGTKWHLDTDHDFIVDTVLPTGIPSDLLGYPVVGDFDGDGIDDLGSWTDDTFRLNLSTLGAIDGLADRSFRFGFPGVRERPVAADFDGDGIDDLGLWVPDRSGATPAEGSEWYLLISHGQPIQDRLVPNLQPGASGYVVDFTPIPFGYDIFAQFGDEFALPVVGNFDPPVATAELPEYEYLSFTNPDNANDVNGDGEVTPIDALWIINSLNSSGAQTLPRMRAEAELVRPYMDTDGDYEISAADALRVINQLNQISQGSSEGEQGSRISAPQAASERIIVPAAPPAETMQLQLEPTASGLPAGASSTTSLGQNLSPLMLPATSDTFVQPASGSAEQQLQPASTAEVPAIQLPPLEELDESAADNLSPLSRDSSEQPDELEEALSELAEDVATAWLG